MLKEKVISFLGTIKSPKTAKGIAVEISGDLEIQDRYSKYSGKELVDFLTLSISSSTRNWKGFVRETINGKTFIDFDSDHVTTPKPNKKTISRPIIEYAENNTFVKGYFVKNKGAFTVIETLDGQEKQVPNWKIKNV